MLFSLTAYLKTVARIMNPIYKRFLGIGSFQAPKFERWHKNEHSFTENQPVG
jgi:hypothetical protein